jgi:protein ImuB
MFGGLFSCTEVSSPETLPDLARGFTPRVEVLRPELVLLDLMGLGRSWPDPQALAEALHSTAVARGLAINVALAASRGVALLVACSREGVTIVPCGQEAASLAPLPLALLQLSDEWQALFQRWGIETLGELAALPERGVRERLGASGLRLLRLARGADEAPFVATPPVGSFACTLDLDWPVDGLEPLTFVLTRVLETLCQRLKAGALWAAALVLDLRLVNGAQHRRRVAAAVPTAQVRTWRTLLLLDLETHPPADAIQSLTLSAEATPGRPTQLSWLAPANPAPEKLSEMLARLRAWTETGRAGRATLLDTHRPGAFVLGSFAPPSSSTARDAAPAPRAALRAIRPPQPAHVTLREGRPSFVAASRAHGAVLDCAGPWRASGDWWDVAWSREEWDVLLAGGGIYRIFLDRLREGWFLEAELD